MEGQYNPNYLDIRCIQICPRVTDRPSFVHPFASAPRRSRARSQGQASERESERASRSAPFRPSVRLSVGPSIRATRARPSLLVNVSQSVCTAAFRPVRCSLSLHLAHRCPLKWTDRVFFRSFSSLDLPLPWDRHNKLGGGAPFPFLKDPSVVLG